MGAWSGREEVGWEDVGDNLRFEGMRAWDLGGRRWKMDSGLGEEGPLVWEKSGEGLSVLVLYLKGKLRV